MTTLYFLAFPFGKHMNLNNFPSLFTFPSFLSFRSLRHNLNTRMLSFVILTFHFCPSIRKIPLHNIKMTRNINKQMAWFGISNVIFYGSPCWINVSCLNSSSNRTLDGTGVAQNDDKCVCSSPSSL